jgi:hypothetical protein
LAPPEPDASEPADDPLCEEGDPEPPARARTASAATTASATMATSATSRRRRMRRRRSRSLAHRRTLLARRDGLLMTDAD